MTNHRTIQPDARKVIVDVDTRTHVHVAVAIDTRGVRLDDRSCAADSDGYHQLITWAERHGRIAAFGIEGTGSYGAGLARAVRRAGHQVFEVNRGDRRTRRIAGKSDTVDAETAARSVLAGQSTAIPKTVDGAVEMMRHLKVARRTAVKARTSAMITLKPIVAPWPLRRIRSPDAVALPPHPPVECHGSEPRRRARAPPVASPSLRPPAHSASLSGPPERRWGGAATYGRHEGGTRSMEPHETVSTDALPPVPQGPTLGGAHRRLPPGLPGAPVPVPRHRPRPRRPSRGLFRTRRAGRRADHLPDAPVSTGPARRRGGHRYHQSGDLGPPPHAHPRRPLGLARHRARLPRPAPRESPLRVGSHGYREHPVSGDFAGVRRDAPAVAPCRPRITVYATGHIAVPSPPHIPLACRAHPSECGRTPPARGRHHEEEPSP